MTASLPDPPEQASPSTSVPKDPDYTSPGRAAVLHPVLIITFIVIGLVIGVGVAAVRPITYKAEARLIVGKASDPSNIAAVAGLATASDVIAQNYARLIGTSLVQNDVRGQIGYEPGGALSATEVPQSPTISVQGTGTSQAAASRLAAAGSAALVRAVAVANQQTAGNQQTLIQQVNSAATTQERAQATVNSLQAQSTALGTTSPAGQAVQAQLITALAALDTAKVQTAAVVNAYQAAAAPDTQAAQVITPLGQPTPGADNRRTNLEIGLIGGVVGGVIVGFALASAVEIRATRRRSRRASRSLTDRAVVPSTNAVEQP